MKKQGKKDFINVIDKSAEELHQKIDNHHSLMASILESRVNDLELKGVIGPSSSGSEGRLKEVLKETIEVLEQTRKAFKSKRLEVLRKKLTQVLIDTE